MFINIIIIIIIIIIIRVLRNISWGVKAAGEKGWQSYHLHAPIVSKSWSLSFLELSGPVICLYRVCFSFVVVLN